MEFNKLSDYQLYGIIQNEKLDKQIRALANEAFNSRKLTKEQIQEIIAKHDSLFRATSEEPLDLRYKIILLIFPFFWVIHVLISSRYLARGQKRKWKEYWLYFCLGLFIWTVAIVIVGRLYFHSRL